MSIGGRILEDLFAQKLDSEEHEIDPTVGLYKVRIKLASGRWALLARHLSEEEATSLVDMLNAVAESSHGTYRPMAEMCVRTIQDSLREVTFARKILPPHKYKEATSGRCCS